jgi:hypothetical protein
VIALPAHQLVFADEVGQAHLRVRFKSGDGVIVNGIAFRSIGQKLGNALTQNRGQPLHVAGSLTVDRYQGSERVQLRVIDVAVPGPGTGGDQVDCTNNQQQKMGTEMAGQVQGKVASSPAVLRHWCRRVPNCWRAKALPSPSPMSTNSGGPEVVAASRRPATRRCSCIRTSPASRAGSKSWPR